MSRQTSAPKRAQLPRCTRCKRAAFSDEISAMMQGQRYNQVAVRCPHGRGWHLAPHDAIPAADLADGTGDQAGGGGGS